MKKLLLSALLLCSLAFSWPVARIQSAMGRVTYAGPGVCSAVAIKPDTLLTVSHCLEDQTFVNETRVRVLESAGGEEGLAVVKIDADAPRFRPLQLGPKPKPGDRVAALGYALGSPIPFVFSGDVISPELPTPDNPELPLTFFSAPTAFGMSGGPIVNERGQLVSVVVGYVNPEFLPSTGLGVSYDNVAAAVKRYR